MTGIEVFPGKEKTVSERGKIPRISLHGRGEFCINETAYQRFFQGFRYVALGFDKEKGQIGFKPTHQKSDSTYPLRPFKSKDNRYYLISGRGFINYYNLSGLTLYGSHKFIPEPRGDWVLINIERRAGYEPK